eukprot:CAMPEP_0181355582 /NCGR_PEP_ID=MMETSP1106-20121128/3979_1 /TAXON_ID=81844 /ORGANISM="Mantoniella antarctica, Strain SL-175" /LENGTH=392 /DNA_ID=CAMNT_0023468337 /DNA_START=65 /DNA_END=1240 /DNA_ORIENTATION=-
MKSHVRTRRQGTGGAPTTTRSTTSVRITLGMLAAVAKKLALQYVLTKVVGVGISRFGLRADEEVRTRYATEVYAEDSMVRVCAVIVLVFNIAQNFATQITMWSADQESRDLASSAFTVNVVVLFMFSFYSADIGSDLVASQRVGGGVNSRRYIMWILTTPSLTHAVALRSRLSRVTSAEGGDRRRVRGDSGGDHVDSESVSPRESSGMAVDGDSLLSSESWQSSFQDELVANIASLTMFVTGFLGTARFVWDSCGMIVPMALLLASFASFTYIAVFIWLTLSETMVRRGMGLKATKDALRNLFVATFSLFPVAHMLAFTGVLDPVLEEKAYCCGDMLMKVMILGNVAVEALFETREGLLCRIKDEQKTIMLEQLQTAVESGDKFISMVSHEL